MSIEPGIPTLGPLEEQVMHILWDHGKLTVREVIEFLPGDPAYTTIATVLRHLGRKGMVTIVKDGRTARHSALMNREEYTAGVMDQVLSTSRDRTASILHFVETITATDRELLLEYLQQQEGRK
ncbi:transcriptional regulator [Corynebacterium glutamicum]|uniref:BlaI/MecI/CopY family transcriptional regulator n=1 Tax=Corynebacterium glutamicum TaxID=1718 RepID=UPI00097A097B|nr:BlaI/MecI/CopY family transcriptional regulator [Corynebacterium glutamicum]GAV95774.1 transcriptional regulator [Corynebacterium glutamicum]